MTSSLRRVTDQWLSDTAALPIDVFRVAVGLLACAHFALLFLQVPDFSGPDGLLDHVMLREIWTFTRWTLLPVGLPDAFFYALYGAAVAASLGVVLGVTVKPCAGFLFVVASCAYRHNFAVMSVDDAIVHLLLLWLLLLPVGRTLRLHDLRADPGACLRT